MSFFNTVITSSALVAMLVASAPVAHAMDNENGSKAPKRIVFRDYRKK